MERYSYPLSVAPMMEVTDSWWRYFARGLSAKTLLYSEMVVDNVILHRGMQDELMKNKFLESGEDGPMALQLGGNDPERVSEAGRIASEHLGSRCVEINLNCGCPSKLVGKSCFGARLMMDPERVRRIVYELNRKCSPPISVKHRLGTDMSGAEYEDTKAFVAAAAAGGARHFIVHARMAILSRPISANRNRSVPPLIPEYAHRLARDFPELTFALNGGLKSLDMCQQELAQNTIASTMVGRAAWYQPCDLLATADTLLYKTSRNPNNSRRDIIQRYADYIDTMQDRATAQHTLLDAPIFRPLFYVFSGLPDAKRFRIALVDATQKRAQALLASTNNFVASSSLLLDEMPSATIHTALQHAEHTTHFLDAPLSSSPFELRRSYLNSSQANTTAES